MANLVNSLLSDKAKGNKNAQDLYQKGKYLKEQANQDNSVIESENVSLQDLEQIQGEKAKKRKQWFLW